VRADARGAMLATPTRAAMFRLQVSTEDEDPSYVRAPTSPHRETSPQGRRSMGLTLSSPVVFGSPDSAWDRMSAVAGSSVSGASSSLNEEFQDAREHLAIGLAAASLDEVRERMTTLERERDEARGTVRQLEGQLAAREQHDAGAIRRMMDATIGLMYEVLYADRVLASTLYERMGADGSGWELVAAAIILSVGTCVRLAMLVWFADSLASKIGVPCGLCSCRSASEDAPADRPADSAPPECLSAPWSPPASPTAATAPPSQGPLEQSRVRAVTRCMVSVLKLSWPESMREFEEQTDADGIAGHSRSELWKLLRLLAPKISDDQLSSACRSCPGCPSATQS